MRASLKCRPGVVRVVSPMRLAAIARLCDLDHACDSGHGACEHPPLSVFLPSREPIFDYPDPGPCCSGPPAPGDESETALLDAIDAGATAYLTKSATADEIIEAVRKASVGEVLIPVALFAKAIARQRRVVTDRQARAVMFAEFTPRELDVLRLLAEGHDTATLATLMGIAPHTVEWHVRHVIEKLGVHSKLQAVIAAARLGLIEL
jgi:DNA-binding CsgD family transcriptional regulator